MMTLAEETAALTGAKLTMPTLTLLQGKPYFPNHNILRSSNEAMEGNRERLQGRPPSISANEDVAAKRRQA
jgi:hypothetical protein